MSYGASGATICSTVHNNAALIHAKFTQRFEDVRTINTDQVNKHLQHVPLPKPNFISELCPEPSIELLSPLIPAAW